MSDPTPPDDTAPVTANAERALARGSGLFSLDPRADAEQSIRDGIEKAFTAFRAADRALVMGRLGLHAELWDIGHQFLDFARNELAELEGLEGLEGLD